MNKEFDPTINIPYPKISITEKNPELAYEILNSYAGEVSELSQVNQYSYQSIYLNEYKELSKILENISIIEMRHFKILGELVEALGLIPYFVTYKNNKPIPWNSDYVNYTTNYRDMLIDNIKKENETIDNYQRIINTTNITNVKDILNRIILDENRHIEIFTKLLMQYDSDQ